jgi:hypothetical protein
MILTFGIAPPLRGLLVFSFHFSHVADRRAARLLNVSKQSPEHRSTISRGVDIRWRARDDECSSLRAICPSDLEVPTLYDHRIKSVIT